MTCTSVIGCSGPHKTGLYYIIQLVAEAKVWLPILVLKEEKMH